MLFVPWDLYAQDFEFMLDKDGNAYYADSVQVFNQDLDSAFVSISEWATIQVTSDLDTLEFSEGQEATVQLSKLGSIKSGDEEHHLVFKLIISIDNQWLKYSVSGINHYEASSKSICANLGTTQGSCGFENDISGWNQFRVAADRYIRRMLSGIEDYLEAK